MLTFDELARANRFRCEGHFHALEQWSVTDWACALAGEAGEACNLAKKLRRLQTHPEWNDPAERNAAALAIRLAEELADVVIYADLLAQRLGFDLGERVAAKFNATSRKVGSDVLL